MTVGHIELLSPDSGLCFVYCLFHIAGSDSSDPYAMEDAIGIATTNSVLDKEGVKCTPLDDAMNICAQLGIGLSSLKEYTDRM